MFIVDFLNSATATVGLKSELERCRADKKKAEADLTSQESSVKQQVGRLYSTFGTSAS